jgi:NADH-quinone oxidoreductase subunit M
MLWMFRRVMHGESKPENKALKDLSGREIAVLVPVIIMILLIGIFPKPFLTRTESSAQRLLSQVVQVQETTVGKVGR